MNLPRFTLLAALTSSAAFAQIYTDPSSGNVGIGTNNPAHKLDVIGGFAHFGHNTSSLPASDNTNGGLAIGWNRSNGGAEVNFYNVFDAFAGSNTRAFVFSQKTSWGTSNDLMTITGPGAVGIGTTTPTALLQVGTTHGNQTLKVGITGNMANSNAEIRSSLAVLASDASATSSLGAVAWNFYNNGNNPSWSGSLLQFIGNEASGNIHGLPASNQGLLLFQNTSNGNIATNGMTPIHISPFGQVAATFAHNGNVGIGTTNPQHKLAVNGTIKAKEIIVETTGWSDYVFADDYRLAPLAEVETHIKTHKHLPGIPSAAQVAEYGVNLGDVQSALLAKVEELTLHLIAQEKYFVAQQQHLAAQQTQLTAQQQTLQTLQRENTAFQTRLQQLETR